MIDANDDWDLDVLETWFVLRIMIKYVFVLCVFIKLYSDYDD